VQAAQLALASDERRVEVAREGRRLFLEGEQPVRHERLALALQLERLPLGLDGVAHEVRRLGAQQDLAGSGALLEPRRDVDGVAGREALGAPDHDLAGVDADPRIDPERRKRVAHLDRRPHGTQSVVLVRLRHAEDGHDRVADKLLDAAAVPLDDRLHLIEIAAEQGAQGFGIDRFAERGRADDVAEEHRDDLAVLAAGRLRGHLGAAGVAEP
jgi:hypothetical protein